MTVQRLSSTDKNGNTLALMALYNESRNEGSLSRENANGVNKDDEKSYDSSKQPETFIVLYTCRCDISNLHLWRVIPVSSRIFLAKDIPCLQSFFLAGNDGILLVLNIKNIIEEEVGISHDLKQDGSRAFALPSGWHELEKHGLLDIQQVLPDLKLAPFDVLAMDSIVVTQSQISMLAFAHHDGTLELEYWKGAMGTSPVHSHAVTFDGPVTCVKFFTTDRCSTCEDTDVRVHLLVGCAVELAVVYWDVGNVGLSNPEKLPGSDKYTCLFFALCNCLF